MITVFYLLARLPDAPFLSAGEVKTLFWDELSQFGDISFTGQWVMSAGPFGADMYNKWAISPPTIDHLHKLLEYSEDEHHGMIGAVMQDNSSSNRGIDARQPSYLSFRTEGHELDYFFNNLLDGQPKSFVEEFNAASSDWDVVTSRLNALEAENRFLRARIKYLGIVPVESPPIPTPD